MPVGVAWELLAEDVNVAQPSTISAHLDSDEFVMAWRELFPQRVVPETKLADPVWIFFNLQVQHACPEADMDGVSVETTERLAYGVFNRTPLGTPTCGDIAGSHTFVAAIDRAHLPRGEVTIRVEREFRLCSQCGRETEQIVITLP